jgi:hypothetical protein
VLLVKVIFILKYIKIIFFLFLKIIFNIAGIIVLLVKVIFILKYIKIIFFLFLKIIFNIKV